MCVYSFAEEPGITISGGLEAGNPLDGTVTLPNGTTYEIDWDVRPDACQSKIYEWADGKLKCVGRVIQESGVPLLEPGFVGALTEMQRDFHVGAQNMYRLQAVAYLTQPWIDFKNAESQVKVLSEKMQKMQDVARAICEAGDTEYDGPTVGCVKTETARGLIAKALSKNKNEEEED